MQLSTPILSHKDKNKKKETRGGDIITRRQPCSASHPTRELLRLKSRVTSVNVKVIEDNFLLGESSLYGVDHVLRLVVDKSPGRDTNCSGLVRCCARRDHRQVSIWNSQMESSSSRVYSFVSGTKKNTSTHATTFSPLAIDRFVSLWPL
jgi:hypothetical protein